MTSPHVPLPKEPSIDRLRADTVTVMVMGVLAAAATITLAVRMYLRLFTPAGISWNLPVEAQPGAASGIANYGADGPIPASPISGIFTHIQVVIPDVNAVSTVCLALSIALGALTALLVIACTSRLAWLLLKNRFFTTQARTALRTLSWALLGGGAGSFVLWHLGANGVEGALGVRATANGSLEWWGWYLVILFAVTSFGLVDLALRRAIRLQVDTQGLV